MAFNRGDILIGTSRGGVHKGHRYQYLGHNTIKGLTGPMKGWVMTVDKGTTSYFKRADGKAQARASKKRKRTPRKK